MNYADGSRAFLRVPPAWSRSAPAAAAAPCGTFWNHEEYDADGRLVARYESFQEFDSAAGTSRNRWVKYDADGWVFDEGRIAASR